MLWKRPLGTLEKKIGEGGVLLDEKVRSGGVVKRVRRSADPLKPKLILGRGKRENVELLPGNPEPLTVRWRRDMFRAGWRRG